LHKNAFSLRISLKYTILYFQVGVSAVKCQTLFFFYYKAFEYYHSITAL